MNKQQLFSRSKTVRIFTLCLIGSAVVFLSLLALGVHFVETDIDRAAMTAMIVTALISELVIIIVLPRVLRKKLGLSCQKCGYAFPLLGSGRVTEENRCPRCGFPTADNLI